MTQDLFQKRKVTKSLTEHLEALADFETAAGLQKRPAPPKDNESPGKNAAGIASLSSLRGQASSFRLKREEANDEPKATVTPFPGPGSGKIPRQD